MSALALMLSWSVGSVAHAAPSPAEVQAALRVFNDHAVFALPQLNERQVRSLLAGDVVKVMDRPGGGTGPRRAFGLLWTTASRDEMWVACQDLHFSQNASIDEVSLGLDPPDKAVWYGIVDLPRPFSDRHWVVDVWNNHGMASASAGRAWEHPWRSNPGGVAIAKDRIEGGISSKVTAQRFADAVEMPANQGAWVVIALSDGSTLLGYHNASQLGGNIPEPLMVRYVQSTLDTTLRTMEKRAREKMVNHYVSGHRPIIGGDGKPVPVFPR